LKLLDDARAELIKCTERKPNISDLNALVYHVGNELKQLVYKTEINVPVPGITVAEN
jgi:hypothetical protein